MILTAKDGQLVHCKRMSKDQVQGISWTTERGALGKLEEEPVLVAVHRSGVGFFGNLFPSKLIGNLSDSPSAGECALIPVVNKGSLAVFLYAVNVNGFSGLSPQHYLELLSWMVMPRRNGVAEINATPTAHPKPGSDHSAPHCDRFNPAQLVSEINELPPLPDLVMRALEMLSDPGVELKAIAAVIGKDQSLVSKLIKISNSALYGRMNRVESLHQALARLGAKTTKSLVLSASMQTYFLETNPGMQTWGHLLWQHAAECGMAARRTALAVGYDDPEKAFVGGVLHDIGKLVLLMVSTDAYRQIQRLKKRDALTDHDAEMAVIGTNHMEIGELLMEKWKMPDSATVCVKFHHRIDDAGEARDLAAITAYANHLSHLHGTQLQWFEPNPDAISVELVKALGLSEHANAGLIQSVIADFQQADLL